MNPTGWKILLTYSLTFMFASAVNDVGKVQECSTEPTEWWFPLAILVFCGTFAGLGYKIGRSKREEQI